MKAQTDKYLHSVVYDLAFHNGQKCKGFWVLSSFAWKIDNDYFEYLIFLLPLKKHFTLLFLPK